MRINILERVIRLAGAFGAALLLIAIYHGIWRASQRPTGRVVGRLPRFLNHPIFYTSALVACFMLLRPLWRPISPRLAPAVRLASLLAGIPLYFGGLALMLWGRLALGDMYNVSSYLGVELFAGHRLIRSGPFAIVRHPMYLGGVLAGLGSLLLYRTWATLLIAASLPALILRARWEEVALAAEFGAEWSAYERRVPAFPPLTTSSQLAGYRFAWPRSGLAEATNVVAKDTRNAGENVADHKHERRELRTLHLMRPLLPRCPSAIL